MARYKYDLYIANDCVDDLVLIKFPAMRSQFDDITDEVQLSIKPKIMKLKLETNNGKNFYTSTKAPVDDGQLFACKLINDKMICHPVSNFISVRADFSHLDIKEEIDPKEEIRPVSVKFAGPEKQNIPIKNTNMDNQQEGDESDEYQRIKYSTNSSRDALLARAKLFGEQKPKVKADPDGEPVDRKPAIIHVPDVKPKIEKMDTDFIYSCETTSAQNSSKKSNQVKALVKDCLLKAKIVSYEEVHQYIRSQAIDSDNVQVNNKDVLDALGELALMVQGNWAVKSETLYGDSSERDCTDVTGISINLFIAARDYLLWLFTQDRFVSRLEYSRKVKLPDYDTLELFNQLAVFRKETKLWELKLPADNKFLEHFTDIVQRQVTFWKVIKANRLSIFKA